MSEHQVQRRLVKSPPELWAEVSDPESLGRRLDALGEIEITRTEPETTVAWEGENVSGTVVLEASGWGTKVTIEATLDEVEVEAAPEPKPEAEPEPEAEAKPEPQPVAEPTPVAESKPAQAGGFFARLFGTAPAPEPEPQATTEIKTEPAPEPVRPPEVEPTVSAEDPEPEESAETPALDGEALEAALEAALDNLGAAHHRPFSRS